MPGSQHLRLTGAVILRATPFLAHATDQRAERSGLGRAFVGTTLVAVTTSRPELVASLAAHTATDGWSDGYLFDISSIAW